MHWRRGVDHHGAHREKAIPQRHMDSGLQPKSFSQNRSQDLLMPGRLHFARVISVLAIARSEAFPVAVSLQVPCMGTRSLAPVRSFGMQALCTQEFLFCGGGFCFKRSRQMTC